MPRSTAASLSTSSKVSAIAGPLERGPDEHRERARQQLHVERRSAGGLAVELYRPLRRVRHFNAHRPPATPPHALSLAAQQIEHRAHTLKGTIRVEGDHVEPAIVGLELLSQPQKPGRQLPAIQDQ